ncbi:hypothetical protein GQ457_16G026650 [Hibiscus cannabinus]
MVAAGRRNVGGRQTITLFIDNLPERLHWQGLWLAFGRHGDVVDAFIATKRNKKGRRFGFVRFSKKIDADRAIERLNGFKLFGSKITVSVAKYNTRVAYWRRVRTGQQETECRKGEENGSDRNPGERRGPGIVKGGEVDIGGTSKGGRESKDNMLVSKVPNGKNSKEVKRVIGHIEDEDLWKCRRCLVGEMTTVCSVRSIENRLHNWGLGEIKVQRLGGKSYLLSFEDDELFTMLEDLNWSYLKEIFLSVSMWSEDIIQKERTTWIEVVGVPIHCWNHITWRRIAELWGKEEALGVNINRTKDGEKMSILITTSQPGMINEVIELEAGNITHQIRVIERGLSDDQGASYNESNEKRNEVKGQVMVSSHSDSSSEVDRNISPDGDLNIETQENEDALNADFLGKINNDIGGSLDLDSKRLPRDKEPGGCNQGDDILQKPLSDIHGENKSSDEANTVVHEFFKRNMAEVEVCETNLNVESLEGRTKAAGSLEFELKKDGSGVDTQLEMGENTTTLHEGVVKDIMGMGFNKKDITCLSPEIGVPTKSVWEANVDEQNKSIVNSIEEGNFSGCVNSDPTLSEGEFFLSEQKSVKKGGKRYGSLWAYQDKVLSEVEKKKRDRASKRAKKKSKGDDALELSGHSLTDSDMWYRWELLTKKARKTLKIGKKLGVQIEGDEREAIKDLALLEVNSKEI